MKKFSKISTWKIKMENHTYIELYILPQVSTAHPKYYKINFFIYKNDVIIMVIQWTLLLKK
jgi:predicted ATP-grasp superfamily ATP-dependent carboligase